MSDLTVLVIPDQFEKPDESSSPAHPRTAVNQHGISRHLHQIFLRLVVEVQQQLGVCRDRIVSPALTVNLSDQFRFVCSFSGEIIPL